MKIYVASSWRNKDQPDFVKLLREKGHEVYDFRRPRADDAGFAWSDIDPKWETWSGVDFREALQHPVARRGFLYDMAALKACDACVLILPCGRSAHLELGYAAGAGKLTIVMLPEGGNEPELMYRMVDAICMSNAELLDALEGFSANPPKETP